MKSKKRAANDSFINKFWTYLAIVLLLLIVVGSFIYFKFGITGNAIYSQGDGSVGNPFVITNCTELQAMNENLTANYVLGNDIDCSDTKNWNGGQGFVPIGNDVYSLTGIFSGNNHFVSNLWINLTLNDSVGLIGSLEGSVLNLNVINASIFGKGYAGGLVGGNYGSIINSSFSGNVSGSADQIGGLVGFNSMDSIITSSYSIVNVFGKNNVGGLIGRDNYGSVTQVYSISNVTASGNNVGGLIGRADRSYSLDNSFSRSNVSGINNVGGLIGYYQINDGGQINNSFTISNIYGTENLGGFIGYISSSLDVYVVKSYSASSIFSSTAVSQGGLYGASNAGTFLTRFFFNNELFSSSDPDGKTTADMKNIATYSGWDFQNIWSINSSKNDGYPYFNYSSHNLPNSIISKPLGYCPSNMYGLGTIDSPCEIISCTQLQAMNDNLTLSYQLMNDIDCSETKNWNGGAGFVPIGNIDQYCIIEDSLLMFQQSRSRADTPFVGNLFGNNHIISDIYIRRNSVVGLFGYISGSNLTGINLHNINFSAGYGEQLISDSFDSSLAVGGLVAVSNKSRVINSSVTGSVSGRGEGNISTSCYVGGLVGKNDGIIDSSFTKVIISPPSIAGEPLAYRAGGISAYSSDFVNNSYYLGDFSLLADYVGSLEYSYFSNNINSITIYSSILDNITESSDINYFKGAVKIKQPFSNWDFNNTWRESSTSYPYLIWQEGLCGDSICTNTESCSSCPSDCGSCPSNNNGGNSGSSGGGGGGGGSGGAIKNNSISTQNGIGLNNNLINYNDNSTNIDFQKNSDSNASSFKLNVFSKGVVGSIVILSILLIIFLVFAKPIAEMFEEYSERRKERREEKQRQKEQERIDKEKLERLRELSKREELERLRVIEEKTKQSLEEAEEGLTDKEIKTQIESLISEGEKDLEKMSIREAKEVYERIESLYSQLERKDDKLYAEIIQFYDHILDSH